MPSITLKRAGKATTKLVGEEVFLPRFDIINPRLSEKIRYQTMEISRLQKDVAALKLEVKSAGSKLNRKVDERSTAYAECGFQRASDPT